MANPITAIASRSCAKNSLLKQTEDDLSKGSSTREVSTADVQQNIGGGRAISGDQTDTTITTPGSGGTPADPGSSGRVVKAAENQMSDEAWKEYLAKETAEQKQKRYAREQAEGLREGYKPPTPATPGTPPTSDTTQDFEMDQTQVKGQENLDLRADIRQEKILNRLDRQAERRQDRFERKGLSGKDKRAMRKQQRKDRAASNIERQQNVQNLIADRRALRDLQRDQGSFGGESYGVGNVTETKEGVVDRVAKESFTPTQVTSTPSGKTKVGEVIEGIGDVFAKKPEGTAVGNALRGVFGKKEEGSFVGNLLRGGKKPAPLQKNYFNK
jgi:hypothetical protein